MSRCGFSLTHIFLYKVRIVDFEPSYRIFYAVSSNEKNRKIPREVVRYFTTLDNFKILLEVLCLKELQTSCFCTFSEKL